ncbi:MAG: hypothetical protein ACXQTD_02815 [Candidatus Syntropharchaeia archaeon]
MGCGHCRDACTIGAIFWCRNKTSSRGVSKGL